MKKYINKRSETKRKPKKQQHINNKVKKNRTNIMLDPIIFVSLNSLLLEKRYFVSFQIKHFLHHIIILQVLDMKTDKKLPKQKMPHIKWTTSTWNKDSHGLYDYESPPQSYKTQTNKIQGSTIIYRDNSSRTVFYPKAQNRNWRDSFTPIANIIFQKKQGKSASTFRFEPIQACCPDPSNYDSTKTFYKVIRQKNPQNPKTQGFPLKPGHIVKMGRVEYMVIEMKNNKQTLTIRDTNHFNENNGIFEYKKKQNDDVEEINQIRCKVCLCVEQTAEDPLISPCQCKGTLLKIHVGCLRQWINSKVKKDINDIATSYNFTKFQCQICKHPFPKIIKISGNEIEMMTINKPTKPYIILESLNRTNQLNKQERCLHLISAKEQTPIKIGRGHQCQIRLTDISVSRSHAKIIFANDEFLIKDERSKFGTLIKFEGAHVFEADKSFSVQYGRTLFEFELVVPQQQDTQQDEEEQEAAQLENIEKNPTQQE